ncbi:hypothetical protein LPJ53_003335, partial [Coemansia erecta]
AAECWQVTRDHAYILEHAGTQSAEQLAWTGVTVTPLDGVAVAGSPEDDRSFAASSVDGASDDMHVVASDTPVSAASAQTLVSGALDGQQQQHLLHEALDGVAKMMRKRPSSDGAHGLVGGLSDEEGRRPARRPRTGEARVSGASDSRMDDGEEVVEGVDGAAERGTEAMALAKPPPSAIPLPAASRLPSRKSRRTRG